MLKSILLLTTHSNSKDMRHLVEVTQALSNVYAARGPKIYFGKKDTFIGKHKRYSNDTEHIIINVRPLDIFIEDSDCYADAALDQYIKYIDIYTDYDLLYIETTCQTALRLSMTSSDAIFGFIEISENVDSPDYRHLIIWLVGNQCFQKLFVSEKPIISQLPHSAFDDPESLAQD